MNICYLKHLQSIQSDKADCYDIIKYRKKLEYLYTCTPTNEEVLSLDFIKEEDKKEEASSERSPEVDSRCDNNYTSDFDLGLSWEDLGLSLEDVQLMKVDNKPNNDRVNSNIADLYIQVCRCYYLELRYKYIFEERLLNVFNNMGFLGIHIIDKEKLIKTETIYDMELGIYGYNNHTFKEHFPLNLSIQEGYNIQSVNIVRRPIEDFSTCEDITKLIDKLIKTLNGLIYANQYKYKEANHVITEPRKKEDYASLKKKIQELEAKKISKQQIANQLGISRRTVYNIKDREIK